MLIFKYVKECKKYGDTFNIDCVPWNKEKYVDYKDVDMKRFVKEAVRQKKMCVAIYDELPIVVDKDKYRRLIIFNAVPSDERYDKAVHVGIIKNKQVIWDYYVKYAPGHIFVAHDEVLDYSYKEKK